MSKNRLLRRSGATCSAPRRRPLPADAGFSIVEVMIASMVAIVLFVIFATSITLAVTQMRDTRFRSEASGIAGERVEAARSLEWDAVAMTYVNSTAPLMTTDMTALLAAETGLDADETLVVDSIGGVQPEAVEMVDDVTYQVWSYVTDVSSDSRRLVVYVTWDVEGRAGSYLVSTVISEVTL